MQPYPDPPWQMYGQATISLYAVPRRSLRLPHGLHPTSKFGWTMGVLAFVQYLPPSPLTYNELIWMPTFVRQGKWKGFYVEKMLVDSPQSLQGGRELWALPKTMAIFERRNRKIEVYEKERHILAMTPQKGRLWLPFAWKIATLQQREGETVSFRAEWKGRVHLASLKARFPSPLPSSWRSLTQARKIFTAAIFPFRSTMLIPKMETKEREQGKGN